MKVTGFIGIWLTNFDTFLQRYNLIVHRELSRRDLHVASISFTGPLGDPAQREKVLEKAWNAMRFLADSGANHLVVFPPARVNPQATPPEAMREICTTCNQIGEAAGEMGFTAGLHNHLGAMVQTQEEIDRVMSMTDPKLFGLSADTAHLHLAGCQVVSTFERYKR